MTEIWKDVCYYKNGVFYDFTGYYQVSNLGRVKSLKREGVTKNGKKFIVYEKILNPHINKSNYRVVTLHKMNDGKTMQMSEYVHRLVGIMFISNPDNKPELDHIIPVSEGGSDEVNNLRWVTSKENTNNPISKQKRDSSRKGTDISEKCKAKQKEKVIIDKVIGINEDNKILVFESAEEGKRNGFRHILDCCRGKRLQDKGYKWYFMSSCPEKILKLIEVNSNVSLDYKDLREENENA